MLRKRSDSIDSNSSYRLDIHKKSQFDSKIDVINIKKDSPNNLVKEEKYRNNSDENIFIDNRAHHEAVIPLDIENDNIKIKESAVIDLNKINDEESKAFI